MAPLPTILFDLDGTLIDTITLYKEAVLTSLKEIGIKATPADFRDWYVRPLHLGQILGLYGENESRVPELRLRRDEIYIELLRTKSEWLPGAEELLGILTNKKIPMGVITGSWMSYVDAIDSHLDVKKYFGPIITADEIHSLMKPHPHGLLLAADRLGADPKDCLYIGDQSFDMEAAKRAGMQGIFIETEWSPKNLPYQPQVKTHAELKTLLEGMLSL